MISFLKRHIPTSIKQQILSRVSRQTIPLDEGKRAFIFLAADYGNIGDLAITEAQRNFLVRFSGVDQVVLVPISQTANLIGFIRKNVKPEDLITIVGGGNMGVLYPDIEYLRQWVISSFPRNRIVCFPQTLDWSSSNVASEKALNRIAKIYGAHPDLHVFARESVSFKKLKHLFSANPSVKVGYVPDIVLSAAPDNFGVLPQSAATGILLALRQDRERVLSDLQWNEVEEALRATGHDLTVTDTHAGGSGLTSDVVKQMLTSKIADFRASQLVVTDRLHGMILAAIAGVPCVVLPSASHKLFHTWDEWLKNVAQIALLTPDDMKVNGALDVALARMLSTPRRDIRYPIIDQEAYLALQDAVAVP